MFNPSNHQQAAGLVNDYHTENWTALQVMWHEQFGQILELTVCDQYQFSQPLKEKIKLPDQVNYLYLRIHVQGETDYYSYSFDQIHWILIDLPLETYQLSDDYIGGPAFFTGAFVGMQCEDTSGQNLPADFRYFKYQEREGWGGRFRTNSQLL